MREVKFAKTSVDKIPMELLLEADPNEQSIRQYLDSGLVFAAMTKNEVIGVVIAGLILEDIAELFNVSIANAFRRKRIGSKLLEFTLGELKSMGVKGVELATGSFGYQLTFYQRLGFRVDSVVKDHFLENYPDPIFEDGIQLKDMLRLSIRLD